MTIDPDDYDLRERRRIADERRGGHTGERDDADDGADDEAPSARQERSRRRDGHRHDQHPRERPDRRDGNRHGRRDRGPDRGSDSEASRQDMEASRYDTKTPRHDTEASGRDAVERNGQRRRNGRYERGAHGGDADRRRNGRTESARDTVEPRQNAPDDEVSVRPGDRADVSRPRRGDSDHARAHDEVVKADRMARDLGFDEGNRQRNGNSGPGPDSGRMRESLDSAGAVRSRQSRTASDRERLDHTALERARLDRIESTRDSPRRPAPRDRDVNAGRDAPEDVGRFQFDTEIRERPRGRASELLRENQLEQLLVHETAAADRLAKPYLSSLPDAYAAERLVFDWLEFLVLNGGYKRTMDALRYYHTVEWLTEDVEAELQDYLVGFSGEVSSTREYDVDDHHLSLVYIARLASMT
ncbi:FlaD/FlaE family flagellar protein [Halobellus salinisoli]|uniref:FlaD/FlaE family flagellar protein n=1 Tax=Halobellus salinisoli TaxID=3108500 RepID=UPI003CE52649